MAYIVFDIGGTQTRVALAEESSVLGDLETYDTPQSYDEGVERLAAAVGRLSDGHNVEAIAGGLPGLFDASKQRLVRAPNLTGWIGEPIAEALAARIGLPVFLENDAALGALGEARQGAGKNFGIVAYIAVGTGVGGARIVSGHIDSHAAGFEPGHQIIDSEGASFGAANGRLERLIAGAGLKAQTGLEAKDIHDPRVWSRAAKQLAAGLVNAAVHWSPHVIVLGGSLICGVDGIPVVQVEEEFKRRLGDIYPELPAIKMATLGRQAGLVGAAEYARGKLREPRTRAM
ncbi:hypothetical protein COU20_02645 [Candidatus Kaiserbacteria bacterium CG10_big_fil_rev_8_21_14_0_10_59_10]|uniref:ROK family protein n=1 Tax=Candidatus Kaiserbacteria bacterium CG10_big_fil_rev_8_21_14_0_10_59_10 TaxID=1974612 RepID=A0A2H0U7K4_9BACT|nr:MAG: hypothetical protein COU20_02645 [Candidatus Kaiserbacteria bacterium CG10_big_fil_rev_8_21_14_0_10_59_10]